MDSYVYSPTVDLQAKADGSDDTASWQKGVDLLLASPGGGLINALQPYRYLLREGIRWDPNKDRPIMIRGSGARGRNESLPGYGTVLFTDKPGQTLIDVPSNTGPAQRFGGPTLEGLNLAHMAGGPGAVLCHIGDVDGYVLRDVNLRGASHTDKDTVGVLIDGKIDVSYALITGKCTFLDLLRGVYVYGTGTSSLTIEHAYFDGRAGGHRLIEIDSGTNTSGGPLIAGCKFECNLAPGAIAIRLAGDQAGTRIIGNSSEGCPIFLYASSTNPDSGYIVDGNTIYGGASSSIGIYCEKNTEVLIGVNRFSWVRPIVAYDGTVPPRNTNVRWYGNKWTLI